MIDDPELPRTGVLPIAEDRARWCVWAPRSRSVDLVLGAGEAERRIAMQSLPRGYFAVEADLPSRGQLYSYSLDREPPCPDPLSRWQPGGVHAPSAVYWPGSQARDDRGWRGIERRDLALYELHVGTFTSVGTFDAIVPRIEALKDLGITCVEIMPVGQFPGSRSWGYDGVFPFAPQNTYGGPDGFHRLVDACHARGMAVFLDVIYNHFGPEGNLFPRFGPYLSDKTRSDWGPAVNYDTDGCDSVRAMVLDNVRMWVRDYRVDGLRLDAADQIYDRSPRHILSEIVEVAHREAEYRGFPCHVFAETDLNDAPRFLHPGGRGGYGLDGYWNDDFHHAAHVVLTGETNGYYRDFADGPRAMAKTMERVFVNDGNWSPFRGRRHGTSAEGFSGDRFLAFTQNHDQVGNRPRSDRLAASVPASAARLAAGLLLLAPRLPMLFMGQEYGETNPFPFFCDFEAPELIEAVREGRKKEFAHFGWGEEPPDPTAATTRDLAVLSWSWDGPFRSGMRRLHRDLLGFRRDSPTLRDFRPARARVLDGGALLEVHRGGAEPTPGEGALILFNLGSESRPFPGDYEGDQPTFRSEITRYGAMSAPAESRLMPHEFVIFKGDQSGSRRA